MNVLITGGMGFIGSHTIVELLERRHDITVIDNYVNSYPDIEKNIKDIVKEDFKIIEGDLKDIDFLERVFSENSFDVVIHFAALKSVNKSIDEPLAYYDNNIVSLINLLKVMQKYNVKKFIFSSSAAVYGEAAAMPVREDNEIGTVTNPYGWTKVLRNRFWLIYINRILPGR